MEAVRTPQTVVSGIGFTEGPIWTRDGRLLVVSMSRGLIYEIDLAKRRATRVAEPGGGPNGMVEDSQGAIWIAQNGGRYMETSSLRPAKPGVQRWLDGGVKNFALDSFSAPNDCAIGPNGRLWFTDPVGEPFGGDDLPGRIWTLDRESGEFDMVADGLDWPNGLTFSSDGTAVYVAETRARRIVRYARASDGISEPEEFARLDRGSPDGLAFDVEGALYVAVPDANCITIFDAAGGVTTHVDLETPGFPTNLCFGGPDLATLFITAARGGAVLALQRDVPGLSLLGS